LACGFLQVGLDPQKQAIHFGVDTDNLGHRLISWTGRGNDAGRLPTTSMTLIALTATEVKPCLGMGAQLGGRWLRRGVQR
jgi:hypothetical protein